MKLLLLKITAWACSVFFVLMGLAYLIGSFFGGLLIILAGLIINPIVYENMKKYAANKYKFELKPWISSVIAVCLIVLGQVIVVSSNSFKQSVEESNKAQAQKSELENEVKKRIEAENKAKEEESKRLEAEKSKKELEAKIAEAQTISSSYDVGNDLGSQDTQIAAQANLKIAALGRETKDQKLFDVTQIVDGDTIKVSELGTLRLIGMDTPETKDPRKPVQCFGQEASKRATELLSGKKVYLEFDPANRIDKYGRTLAYVYREDGYFFNAEMIKDGFANSYTKYPHPKLEEFNKYQASARESKKGLWSPDTCNGDSTQAAKTVVSAPVIAPSPTQPVTKAPGPTPAPSTDVYYANCDAVRAAGKAPIYSGQPGYRTALDRDRDGIACDK